LIAEGDVPPEHFAPRRCNARVQVRAVGRDGAREREYLEWTLVASLGLLARQAQHWIRETADSTKDEAAGGQVRAASHLEGPPEVHTWVESKN
jgi:hypothetical protein